MLYLGNNEMGCDAASLGFPSIASCEAIVYQTSTCLYGMHEMPSGKAGAFAGKAAAFARWVQGQAMNHGGQGVALYGVINQEKRWFNSQNTDWTNELISVATALGWAGAIWRGRVTNHIGRRDSVYVRFDVVNAGAGNSVAVRFKRWSKMELDATDPKPLNLVFLRDQLTSAQKKNFSEGQLQAWMDNPTFQVIQPNPSEDTPDVYSVRRKYQQTGQEGNLNGLALQQVR